MDDVKVSIIIPVYNVAPFLDKCLSSCIDQTFRNIEIIVVNDGSTDTSCQIIATYATIDKRVVLVNKQNEGLIYARKSGLDIAQGEFVFHLDGDDYIERNTIEELYKEAVNVGSDYVMAGFCRVFRAHRQEYYWDKEMTALSKQDLLAFMLGTGLWPIWGKLIRKSLFDEIVYTKIFMGEDLYLNMQITLKVRKVAVLDKCLYNYVWHEDSVTVKNSETTLILYIEMLKSVWGLLNIYPYEQRIRELVYSLFIPYFIEAIKNYRKEIKGVLRLYYWEEKEVRRWLWENKRSFYFLCGGYIHTPTITSWAAIFGSRMKALLSELL